MKYKRVHISLENVNIYKIVDADYIGKTEDGLCLVWSHNKTVANGEEDRYAYYALFFNGKEEWRNNGEFHKENGPAVIYPDGRQEWWTNGKFMKRS